MEETNLKFFEKKINHMCVGINCKVCNAVALRLMFSKSIALVRLSEAFQDY